MLRSMIAILGVLLVISPFNPAAAQPVCGERNKFTNRLEQSFAEHPIAMGLTDKGAVLEVFASQNGSWTFLITMPNGLTCVVASGQSWETLAAVNVDQTN